MKELIKANEQFLAPTTGILTNRCFRLFTTNKISLPDGRWTENEGVLFSNY